MGWGGESIDKFNLNYLLIYQSRKQFKIVTLDHKTSRFVEIEIYSSSETWINKLSIDVFVCYDRIQLFENLESECAKKSKYWENRLKSCPNEVFSNAHY